MRTSWKVLGHAAAIALAAVALPVVAGPQKSFGLSADLSGVTYDSTSGLRVLNVPVPITVTLTNLSPPSQGANSNINSFTLSVTGIAITSFDVNACLAQGASSCSLDTNTNTISVGGLSPPLQAKGTFPLNIQANSCGDGTWSATVWTGSTPGNGQPFTGSSLATSVNCGDAGCGVGFTAQNAATATGSIVSGTRGAFNKDGSTCATTDYTATNTISKNNKLHFAWNASPPSSPDQSGATFRYTVTFSSAGRPRLSWKSDNTGPVFVDAQPCEVTQFQPLNLPQPYGTLAQSVNSSKNKIQVNVMTAPTIPLPFPIIVESERMQVTAISPGNWTVMRGQGGTQAMSHTVTAATPILIMSTPRPLLVGPFDLAQQSAGYKVGDQAHGCVASPLATLDDLSPWDNVSTFDIIDIDDIWSSGR